MMTGKCSVPMWLYPGIPAGTCGKDAYGEQPKKSDYSDFEWHRRRYDKLPWAPDYACPAHGGPKPQDVAHKCDPCIYCGVPHDDVPAGPCKGRGDYD